MAKTISWGINDTEQPGYFPDILQVVGINFKEDFSVKSSSPSEEIVVNTTSPLDRVEAMTTAYTNIQNIYQNTSIDPKVYAPSKRGAQIMFKAQHTLSVTDDVDPSYRIDLPLQSHLVFRFPASEHITHGVLEMSLMRLLNSIYLTGEDGALGRLEAVMRGAVSRADI